MTPEELVQGCIRKDHNAWREFVKLFTSLAAKSVRYKLAKLNHRLPKNDVNDIVQEIFLVIWEKDKLAGINNLSALKSWLVMVSINITSNYCRRRTFKSSINTLSLDDDTLSEQNNLNLHSSLISPKLNTECSINQNEVLDIMHNEISKLDTKKQLALKLNIYHGKKYKDIAAIINMPEATVATLIARAKKYIKRNLKNNLNIRGLEDVLHFF